MTFSVSVIGLISVQVSLSYGIWSFKIVCGKQKGSYFLLLRLENKNLDFEQIKTEIYYQCVRYHTSRVPTSMLPTCIKISILKTLFFYLSAPLFYTTCTIFRNIAPGVKAGIQWWLAVATMTQPERNINMKIVCYKFLLKSRQS